MSFQLFNLSPNLLMAIEKLGYTTPTEIQALSIPILLEHPGDFVGQAQTGTGKTASFGLPLLNQIDFNSEKIQALILTPTRELAKQVSLEMGKFGQFSSLRLLEVYGGVSYSNQIRGLKHDAPHVVVGTPGRIIDLINQGALQLNETTKLVIDEADEMLNMGFLEDVQRIIDELSSERKVWMFSATMPTPIKKLINERFSQPEFVKIQKKNVSNDNISQYYSILKKGHFVEGLKRIIEIEDVYGIIFSETKREAQQLSEELNERNIPTVAIHGDMGQAQREASMRKFKERKVNLMVCTDVAARGIDVPSVTHVVNLGFPRNHESYVHRIGRTGRAGSKGTSITFLTPDQKFQLRKIKSITKKDIELYKIPGALEIKKVKVSKELNKMATLKEAIIEKGENFRIDESFESFKDYFKDMGQDNILKLLFSWKFNKDLRHIDDLGDISNPKFEEFGRDERRRSSRSSRGGSYGHSKRNNYGGSRRSGERGSGNREGRWGNNNSQRRQRSSFSR